uniref:Transposase IS4-like domain-containing protein n=1 Tax=Tanacetum cinerariifolium TaxID=118510 RepID=A0A699GGE9_TANCI|nr:hypothetical protein [Tanacetum cinerariifolium]
MMMKRRIGLYAEHKREDQRIKIGNPLIGLTKHVDFEALAAGIDAAAPRPKGGRPPYSAELMVKILVLEQLYNLADDALKYQLLDRRSRRGQPDLGESPAAFTAARLHGALRPDCRRLGWTPHKRAQKDVDARWTKKHGRSYFGYNLHASLDRRYKLMRKMVVTHAAVAHTTLFEPRLDLGNTSPGVYADRGYWTAQREATLKQAGWRVYIQCKGSATKGVPDTQKKRNRRIATPPRPRRARLGCAVAHGRQSGTLHGYCPRHHLVASQSGKLQPETPGVSEGRPVNTVLNEPGRGRQTRIRRDSTSFTNSLARPTRPTNSLSAACVPPPRKKRVS